LGSSEIGVLAALGLKQVKVQKIPIIAVFSVGSEVNELSKPPAHGKTYDLNGYSLSTAVMECGAKPVYFGVVDNDESELTRVLKAALASSELAVHRAIYRETRARAIVHAHPPYANTLALVEKEIVPRDEWLEVIGRVPVLGWGMEIKPGMLDDVIADALKEHRVVMVYGHGSFAIGQLLEEAFSFTTVLEEAAKVLCLLKSIHSGDPSQV